MLRRHASLIIAIFLVALVTGACIVRSGPRRSGPPSYRGAPPSDHRKGKHKKHKKHRKGGKHRHYDAPRGDF